MLRRRAPGVREYWIVNPRGLKVYVFVFADSPQGEGVPEEYTFEDTVPVHISGGACRVDFHRILGKIGHMLE